MLVALLFAGCSKEKSQVLFLAESEAPAGQDAKTQLRDERFILWEEGDEISFRSLDENDAVRARFKLVSTDSSTKAVFESYRDLSEKNYNSNTQYLALYPYSKNNILGSGNPVSGVFIDIPAEQPYVGDETFGRTAMPMVAYGGTYSETSGPYTRLLFHNLAGIVRIQMNNATGEDVQLQTITFSSDQGLAGKFEVVNPDKHDPYLKKASGTSNTLTISFAGTRFTLGSDLKTFYIPLPAQNVGNIVYNIKMTVTTTDGKSMNVNFTAPIRRNGLTKMPALNITEWARNGATVSLAGNGTIDRPFLIYTWQDLVKVRNAFNNAGSINGVNLSTASPSDLNFRIMRNDIVLQSEYEIDGQKVEGWTGQGIAFRGVMTYGANQSVADPGIANNTDVPLFLSIASGSSVIGIPVRGTSTQSFQGIGAFFSPFCTTNEGTISNCRVSNSARFVMNTDGIGTVGLAGLCVTNNGTIENCGCGGTLKAPNVAGICYTNQGTIKGCYASSPMKVFVTESNIDKSSSYAAGICFNNQGTIEGCYFAANSSHLISASWGGIAYNNSATITNCYIASSGVMYSTTSVGGVVHTMTGGTLDYCRNESDVMNVTAGVNGLGGIVNTLSGGVVRNCIRHSSGSFTCAAGPKGGFVATMTGTPEVYNCAFYGDMSLSTATKCGAFVGDMQGGTIKNCYGIQSAIGDAIPFYGDRDASVTTIDSCYSNATSVGITTVTDYSGLDTTLNGNITSLRLSSCHTWVAGTSTVPPTLATSKK